MIFEVLAFFFLFLVYVFVNLFCFCFWYMWKRVFIFFSFLSVFITTKEFKNRSFVKKNFKTCFVSISFSLAYYARCDIVNRWWVYSLGNRRERGWEKVVWNVRTYQEWLGFLNFLNFWNFKFFHNRHFLPRLVVSRLAKPNPEADSKTRSIGPSTIFFVQSHIEWWSKTPRKPQN